MLAWKFITADGRPAHGDEPVWHEGDRRHFAGPIIPCESGYHASLNIHDAFNLAPTTKLARVRLSGTIVPHDNKLCASDIEILEIHDVTDQLYEYACQCAEVALLIAEVDDPRCWEAIEARRAWLRREIDDEQLASIASIASIAARYAARYAARAKKEDTNGQD